MRRFVMGDIHGAYKALLQCFERAGFNYEQDLLIQLGDVADGFNEVYECVEELLKLKNLIVIKGNHDEWFNQFCQTGYHEQNWSQGGRGTAFSYLKRVGKEDKIVPSKYFGFKTELDPQDIPAAHREFFANQLLYHIDDSYNCFVHGGFNRHIPFFNQSPEIYYWERNLWIEALEFEKMKKRNPAKTFDMVTPFNMIYLGHTSTLNWKSDQPLFAANIVNLDTGAGWGGRLSMMEVGTKNLWQSELVGQLYGYIGR